MPHWTKCGVCDERDAEPSQVSQEEEEVLVEPVSVLGELRFLPSPRTVSDNTVCSPPKTTVASEPSVLLRSPSLDSMAVNFSPQRLLKRPLAMSPEPAVAIEGGLGELPSTEVGNIASVTPGRPAGPGSAFIPSAVAAIPMAPAAAVATPPREIAPVLAATTPPPAVAVARRPTSPQQRSPYRGGVLSLFTPSPATPPARRGPFDVAGMLPEGVKLQDLSEDAQLEFALAVSLHEAPTPARAAAAAALRPADLVG